MKLLIDAQLPRRLALYLKSCGFECLHTLDLPKRNSTSDKEIVALSMQEKLVVISKDSDFYDSFMQKGEPFKLIYLKVGNISTNEIISLFGNNLDLIMDSIHSNYVIELSNKNIIIVK